jgi:hypothetical protein
MIVPLIETFGWFSRDVSWLLEANPARRRAVSVANLATAATTTDAASFLTASITPTAGQIQYIGVTQQMAGGQPTPTVTGCSLTWVQEETQILGTTRRLTVFRAFGTPTTGQLTIDFGVNTQTACAWSVVQCAGANASGTAGSVATRQSVPATAAAATTITSTLAKMEHARNVHLCFVALAINTAITPGSGFAELGAAGGVGVGTNAIRLQSMWAINDPTCDPSFASADVAVISLEVRSG